MHVDTAEIKINKQKWYLFVAIDRATRFAYIEVYDNKRMLTAADFLKEVQCFWYEYIYQKVTFLYEFYRVISGFLFA